MQSKVVANTYDYNRSWNSENFGKGRETEAITRRLKKSDPGTEVCLKVENLNITLRLKSNLKFKFNLTDRPKCMTDLYVF